LTNFFYIVIKIINLSNIQNNQIIQIQLKMNSKDIY